MLSAYGSQVCPKLDTLSFVNFGILISASFFLMLIFRKGFEQKIVCLAHESTRAKRQFCFDFALCIFSGIFILIFNILFYNFSVVSGLKLITGYLVIGFFIAMDMSLVRSHLIIKNAVFQNPIVSSPPDKFTPMTRKLSTTAIIILMMSSAIIGLVIFNDMTCLLSNDTNSSSYNQIRWYIVFKIFFIMIVLLIITVNLIVSYAKNLNILFKNEIKVLKRVSNGDLSKFIPVSTIDEFGVIAGYTNNMILGLRQNIQLITTINLAKEIQQNILPQKAPCCTGLDIASTSIYCDYIGGDYYDYLILPNNNLGVIVADASGHGVEAALSVTTCRAFLRATSHEFKTPASLMDKVNKFLVVDSLETGHFVTMFFLEIDMLNKKLRWVRAGHDPAILYDPIQNNFRKLAGAGIALGVNGNYKYTDCTFNQWAPDSIIVIATDGIKEALNSESKMFGTKRVQEIIRMHAKETAESIKQNIIKGLKKFTGKIPLEDDITLTVIKVVPS